MGYFFPWFCTRLANLLLNTDEEVISREEAKRRSQAYEAAGDVLKQIYKF